MKIFFSQISLLLNYFYYNLFCCNLHCRRRDRSVDSFCSTSSMNNEQCLNNNLLLASDHPVVSSYLCSLLFCCVICGGGTARIVRSRLVICPKSKPNISLSSRFMFVEHMASWKFWSFIGTRDQTQEQPVRKKEV